MAIQCDKERTKRPITRCIQKLGLKLEQLKVVMMFISGRDVFHPFYQLAMGKSFAIPFYL